MNELEDFLRKTLSIVLLVGMAFAAYHFGMKLMPARRHVPIAQPQAVKADKAAASKVEKPAVPASQPNEKAGSPSPYNY